MDYDINLDSFGEPIIKLYLTRSSLRQLEKIAPKGSDLEKICQCIEQDVFDLMEEEE